MAPESIKLNKNRLEIEWNDKQKISIGLEYLRNQCPCADCKGEQILTTPMRPVKRTADNPEMYKIKDIQLMGNYGIKIFWGDGHNTGVYNWEYLKELANGEADNKEFEYKPLI